MDGELCHATCLGKTMLHLQMLNQPPTQPSHTLFNGPLSGTTWVSWYKKGTTNLDFTEARDSEWQCHQLGCMQVCTQVVQDKGTTWVRWYQKGKTNLDFTEARDSEWQWHQLGNMQVCISFHTDNHASTPPLSFLQARCHSCRPTDSIKALKVHSHHRRRIQSK